MQFSRHQVVDKSAELDQHLSDSIVELKSPFLETEKKSMSITGLEPGSIQAKLAEIKQKAKQRQMDGLAKIEAAYAAGVSKVDAEMEKAVQKINKEVDDSLHEFAQFTNGAPE